MKRIRVTVTEEYLLPDDWEIVKHPEDDIDCLHGNHQYFLPDLDWAERSPYQPPASPKIRRSGYWVSVDNDRGDWFIDRMQTSATEFQQIA